MKAAVFAYSRRGCQTARRVLACLSGGDLAAYAVERLGEPDFQPIPRPSRPFYGALFAAVDAMVFVGSVGIAVREIAPHVKDKTTDPAVVAVDELGKFAVPLLSGHIGGANDLALTLAAALGATPVITTATDINRRFSVDAWATRQGFAISSLAGAKAVSAAVLEGNVPLCSDFPIATALPDGLTAGDTGALGIYITCRRAEPFEKTLRLIPPLLHLGIGCRRGAEAAAIGRAVETVLAAAGLDARAVKCAASVDLKAAEPDLLAFCRERGWPISFYSAETLRAVPGEFTASAFVADVAGVDNVCERAAMVGAKELIVKKTALNGVTVAVAAEAMEVRFE